MSHEAGDQGTGAMEALYPFLYSDSSDLADLMAEVDTIDYLFVAPSTSVHRIQEAQTTIYHVLWELTLAAFAPRRAAGRP